VKPRSIGVALLFVASVCFSAVSARPPDADPVAVRLLAFNDFHGNLEPPGGANGIVDSTAAGGVEYLATHLARLKAGHPNTLIVASGDNIGASPLLSSLFHDEPAIEALNAAGVAVSSVGNHEFDKGPAELGRMQKGGCHPVDGCQGTSGFSGAAFEYLAANVFVAPGVKGRGPATLFPASTVREIGGVKVGFIGMTLQGTPQVVLPAATAGLTFRSEVDTANAIVPELKRQGVHAIVLLLHQGGIPKRENYNGCEDVSGPIVDIAKGLSPDIAVIVTGHTHYAYNCTMSGKLVTSAMSFGRIISVIDLRIDPGTDEVTSKIAQNVIVTRDVPRSAAETLILDRYRPLYRRLAERPAGAITMDISRRTNAAGESALGDVIADAQLEFARRHAGADVAAALMNQSGIRGDLVRKTPATGTAGAITYEQVFDVAPFGNRLILRTMTGDLIARLLESQFRAGGVSNLLQVSSGFTYAYDLARPEGRRVDRASIRIDGRPIAASSRYRILVNEFLANGGDGLDLFKAATGWADSGADIDSLLEYFQAHAPVAPGPQNRIKSGRDTSASQ
jgi:5'-nucleotidase